MSFVSYAQNYEDVILMRALRGVAEGFYIDVGAQHPRNDSVTKAFYDLGWHGINIEPVAHWHRMLVEQRPRDINLCVAAGAGEGTIDLFEVQDSGLSTTSAEFARRHRDAGLPVQPPRRVPVRRLDTICIEHGVSQVHFLKVDAEGAEADVLGGIDWRAIRPWVVLVEATEPNSRTSNHAEWESLLTGHDYDFVYQDGLNRFYLAREHADLAPAFAAPPNVFDAFVRRDQVDEANRLLELLRESDSLLKDRARHIEELAGRIGERDAQVAIFLEAHRRDVGQIEALHADLVRMAETHRQSSEAMQAEIEAREQRIVGLEAAGVALREQLQGMGRSLEQRDLANARLSRDLMASQADQLASEAARMATHAVRLAAEAETAQVRRALDAERQEYARVMASRSWRLTAPLRVVATSMRETVNALESGSRALARLRPVRTLVAALLSPFPGLARRVKRRLYGEPTPLLAAMEGAEPAPLPLTEDAEEILARSPVPPVAGPRR
ncbi:MAG: FkbM family methyltransferase [Gammaproteobacteria bacterium]|nr:FkbM family methyltransferase [Gammaproteobacteria bacterium]